MTLVVEGLFIFLATFLIGFATVQIFSPSNRPLFIPQQELVDSCQTNDDVGIGTVYFGVGNETPKLDGMLITNDGVQSIYYCENLAGGLGETIIYPDGSGRGDFFKGAVCNMKEVKPKYSSKTYHLWTYNPQARYSMEFRYYFGESRLPRIVKTHFADGSFKSPCIEENFELP